MARKIDRPQSWLHGVVVGDDGIGMSFAVGALLSEVAGTLIRKSGKRVALDVHLPTARFYSQHEWTSAALRRGRVRHDVVTPAFVGITSSGQSWVEYVNRFGISCDVQGADIDAMVDAIREVYADQLVG